MCVTCMNIKKLLHLQEPPMNIFIKEHFGHCPAKLQNLLLHYIKCVKLKSVSIRSWAFSNMRWYKKCLNNPAALMIVPQWAAAVQ